MVLRLLNDVSVTKLDRQSFFECIFTILLL